MAIKSYGCVSSYYNYYFILHFSNALSLLYLLSQTDRWIDRCTALIFDLFPTHLYLLSKKH